MTATEVPRRKYAPVKIKPGDYLLPGNDGYALWRIAKYEDGPSNGLLDMPRDREFWGVWRYTKPLAHAIHAGEGWEVTEWEDWDHLAAHMDTRAEAIAEALRLGET